MIKGDWLSGELVKQTLTGIWFDAVFWGVIGDCWSLARFIGGEALLGGCWGGLSGASVLFGFWYKSKTYNERNVCQRDCNDDADWLTYLMTYVFQNILSHVFNVHVPPLLMVGSFSFPVIHIVLWNLTSEVSHSYCDNFRLPLKTKRRF